MIEIQEAPIDHAALTELRLDGGQAALLRLNAPPERDAVR